MKIRCKLGFHKWIKYGGPKKIGCGTFVQWYRCKYCEEMERREDGAD